jgi:phospholipid transport system substrate-binding protein
MLTRRHLLVPLSATAAMAFMLALAPSPALAQTAAQAEAFIRQTGNEITAAVNGSDTTADKQQKLQAIVDHTVDINDVARFCLGRFWRTATPQQQKEYIDLFHRVLMINITGKVGEYQGVSFALGRAQPREGGMVVPTIVTRPNNPPSPVDWLLNWQNGSWKIIDVIAEGTSLRITQRSDYASYLSHNNGSVQALIDALRKQASQQG